MSTDLHAVQTFAAGPEVIFAKYSDRAFLEGRLQAVGGIDPQVTTLETTGAGTGLALRIVTQQAIPASALPSMVSSLMPGDPLIVRTEKWRRAGGSFVADFDVLIKGAPASMKGTMTLAAGSIADSSTVTIDGQASVPIPLFGGKIESVIVEQLDKLLLAEETYLQRTLGAAAAGDGD
ncbi:MAG: DUF2505 domain-containing protein [Actinomycetota bacterium]|nr:DUF2505 domain-containing protein [Actinomycetota bacterium]